MNEKINYGTLRRIDAIYFVDPTNTDRLVRYEPPNPLSLASIIRILVSNDVHFCKHGLELLVPGGLIKSDGHENHIQLTALGSEYFKELLPIYK